ncbi:NPCBM/NEW2 domain-containing protein [Deinococcus koreensis]|nr:NPCBM/NEW2 domain-containing protein [Deinococcus koreensis]
MLSMTLSACSSAGTPSLQAAAQDAPALKSGFLSDQLDSAPAPVNGWGPVERDRANGDDAAGDGPPLSLSGVSFTKGLGVHANSELSFVLDGRCSRFRASVGVDDSVRVGGKYNARGISSLTFTVYAGTARLFDSGVMTEKSSTQTVDVAIPADARTLRLVVGDGGNWIGYDHGDWANARVECSVPTPVPTPAPAPAPAPTPKNVAYRGVSAAMWSEIDARASQFGDPHNCHARVDRIPGSGLTISPGDGNAISAALGRSNTVVLKGGTYRISDTVDLSGKTLVGAPGEDVVIDGRDVLMAVRMGQGGTLSNVRIIDTRNVGIELGSGGTAYRVSVARTGRSGRASGYLSTNGRAFVRANDDSRNNCVVSTEARDSYNDRRYDGTLDGVTDQGGNGDGYVVSSSTIIDSYAYNNSDDGFDFWESKESNYVYFSEAFEGGKSPLGFPNPTGKSGDGNGFKLGRGDQVHYIYKSRGFNNKQSGFTLNSNTGWPVIMGSEAFGNEMRDWDGLPGNTRGL